MFGKCRQKLRRLFNSHKTYRLSRTDLHASWAMLKAFKRTFFWRNFVPKWVFFLFEHVTVYIYRYKASCIYVDTYSLKSYIVYRKKIISSIQGAKLGSFYLKIFPLLARTTLLSSLRYFLMSLPFLQPSSKHFFIGCVWQGRFFA